MRRIHPGRAGGARRAGGAERRAHQPSALARPGTPGRRGLGSRCGRRAVPAEANCRPYRCPRRVPQPQPQRGPQGPVEPQLGTDRWGPAAAPARGLLGACNAGAAHRSGQRTKVWIRSAPRSNTQPMRAESFGVVADKWRGCKYKESSHSCGILNDGGSTLTHYHAGSIGSASLGVKQGGCPWFNEQITEFLSTPSPRLMSSR